MAVVSNKLGNVDSPIKRCEKFGPASDCVTGPTTTRWAGIFFHYKTINLLNRVRTRDRELFGLLTVALTSVTTSVV